MFIMYKYIENTYTNIYKYTQIHTHTHTHKHNDSLAQAEKLACRKMQKKESESFSIFLVF